MGVSNMSFPVGRHLFTNIGVAVLKCLMLSKPSLVVRIFDLLPSTAIGSFVG
jgi:hypothetical protein